MAKPKSTQLKVVPQSEAPGGQPTMALRKPIFDVAPQLPHEQSEMMELAARVVSDNDDERAKALIAIVRRIAEAEDFADRDRLANDAIRGAYLMSFDISEAIDRFCAVQ